MSVLYFMGIRPTLEDGVHSSSMRCNCPTRANLRAIVQHGKVIEAGCPVCGQAVPCEVCPNGTIGFFPPGTVVI
jgi:hypothetical protein